VGQPATDWVRRTYRRRFGIETSYRQMNQGRIRTSTRRPELRLLFVAVALILRNVWVGLRANAY
jgi:putative transposase